MKYRGIIILLFVLLCLYPVRASAAELKVEYEGDAHKLLAVPDDFFTQFGELMPGDRVSESVKLTSDADVEFYFQTRLEDRITKALKDGYEVNAEDESGRAAALLKEMQLEIQVIGEDGEEKMAYSGSLAATALSEPTHIGNYSSGYEGRLEFSLYMPLKLSNVYAKSQADVIWVFSVEEKTEESSGSYEETDGETEVQQPETEHRESPFDGTKSSGRKPSKPAILGIDTDTWLLALICILCGAGAVGLLILIKRRRR